MTHEHDQHKQLKHTPLHSFHRAHKAKMGEFAGYDMPIYYEGTGALEEHMHVRKNAAFFDVSHMGQAWLKGPNFEACAAALELISPSDLRSLQPGAMRYTVLLNSEGGVVDDLIAVRGTGSHEESLFLIVNATRCEIDFEYIASVLPEDVHLNLQTYALIAIQGPRAHAHLSRVFSGFPSSLKFMTSAQATLDGVACLVMRSGYTGEDGYEIAMPSSHALAFCEALEERTGGEVVPAGLAARDSLRLEAGLCLYGHELNENTTPVEAGLSWVLSPSRCERKDFPGAQKLLDEIEKGPFKKRVGIILEAPPIAREKCEIVDPHTLRVIGVVKSGGYSPVLEKPIAMGFVEAGYSAVGDTLGLVVRAHPHTAHVCALPFVPRGKPTS